jgi:hypothetical protein
VSAEQPARDLRELAWRCLVAIGAGAITGAVVGGIGGRLVMLVIRLQSDGSVRGLVTDDGFTIGQFSTATMFLMTVAAGLGAASGMFYLLLRRALPRRGRALGWGVVLGLFTGADILEPANFDFVALDSKPFIVASFVLLPMVAALVIAIVIERLLTVEPWSRRGLTVVLVLGALPLVPVLPVFLVVAGAALAVRRAPRVADGLQRLLRVAVPIGLSLFAVRSAVELWSDATGIL